MTISTSTQTLCKCVLVNGYGDGHNHELRQYEKVCEIVNQVSAQTGSKIILLGNVVFGDTCLDALVIGDFGIIILEFKSYRSCDTIRINRQKQFLCLDGSGNPVKDDSGKQLVVKGGSCTNPIEQAKKNRIKGSELLKKVFEGTVVRNIPIRLSIIFQGKKRIDGMDNIEPEVREWLNVMGDDKLFDFMVFFQKENHNKFSEDQISSLLEYIDVNLNNNIKESVDNYRQAVDLFKIKNYKDALCVLKKCDATRAEVRELELRIYYNMGFQSEFQKNATAALQSGNVYLKARANELLGLAYYNGSNGMPTSLEDAVKHLEAAAFVYNHSKLISEIKDRIVSKRISEARYKAKKENEENEKGLLSRAVDPYKEGSRIASSALWIVVCVFIISILIPGRWELRGIGLSLIGVGVMVYILYKDWWDTDRWFIRKDPQEYTNLIRFRTINVDDNFLSFKFPRLRAFAYGLLPLLIVVAMFLFEFLIVKAVLRTGIANSLAVSLYQYCQLNILYWVPFFMLAYFIVSLIPFVYSLWDNISAQGTSMTNDMLQRYYIVAIPTVINERECGFRVAWSISFMALKFSIALTIILSVLGVAKPVLYKLISYLLESV